MYKEEPKIVDFEISKTPFEMTKSYFNFRLLQFQEMLTLNNNLNLPNYATYPISYILHSNGFCELSC